jgi:hypothetical protein
MVNCTPKVRGRYTLIEEKRNSGRIVCSGMMESGVPEQRQQFREMANSFEQASDV